MASFQTIRLNVSFDEDFFPALIGSVSDFVSALDLSRDVAVRAEREMRSLFEKDLSSYASAKLFLRIGCDGKMLCLSVLDSAGKLFAKRNVAVA